MHRIFHSLYHTTHYPGPRCWEPSRHWPGLPVPRPPGSAPKLAPRPSTSSAASLWRQCWPPSSSPRPWTSPSRTHSTMSRGWWTPSLGGPPSSGRGLAPTRMRKKRMERRWRIYKVEVETTTTPYKLFSRHCLTVYSTLSRYLDPLWTEIYSNIPTYKEKQSKNNH